MFVCTYVCMFLLREESAKINEELLSDNDRLEQLVDEQTQLVCMCVCM